MAPPSSHSNLTIRNLVNSESTCLLSRERSDGIVRESANQWLSAELLVCSLPYDSFTYLYSVNTVALLSPSHVSFFYALCSLLIQKITYIKLCAKMFSPVVLVPKYSAKYLIQSCWIPNSYNFMHKKVEVRSIFCFQITRPFQISHHNCFDFYGWNWTILLMTIYARKLFNIQFFSYLKKEKKT